MYPTPLAACASSNGTAAARERPKATLSAIVISDAFLFIHPSQMVMPGKSIGLCPRSAVVSCANGSRPQFHLRLRARQHLRLERVVPTIEIKIAAAPLDLTALEV